VADSGVSLRLPVVNLQLTRWSGTGTGTGTCHGLQRWARARRPCQGLPVPQLIRERFWQGVRGYCTVRYATAPGITTPRHSTQPSFMRIYITRFSTLSTKFKPWWSAPPSKFVSRHGFSFYCGSHVWFSFGFLGVLVGAIWVPFGMRWIPLINRLIVTQAKEKKKLPRRWSGGLSLLFIKCLWHFTRTKMDYWHLVFVSMVPIITSCQVSPLALPCHLNGASEASTSHECLCSHSPNLHPVPLLLPSLRHGLRHRISLLRSQQ